MARPSISQVIANALVAFPDNASEAITPAILRNWISYMLSAFYPAYRYLSRLAANVQTLGTSAVPVSFDTSVGSPIVDYSATAATGTITRTDPGTCRFQFTADVEAAVNRIVTFTLYKNGSSTPWRVGVTTQGAGKPVSVAMPALEYSLATATYQMQATCDTAGTAVTLSNMVFLAETVPAYDYV